LELGLGAAVGLPEAFLDPLEPLMIAGQQTTVEFNGTRFPVCIDAVHPACGDSDVTYDVAYGAGTYELGVTADRFRAQ